MVLITRVQRGPASAPTPLPPPAPAPRPPPEKPLLEVCPECVLEVQITRPAPDLGRGARGLHLNQFFFTLNFENHS